MDERYANVEERLRVSRISSKGVFELGDRLVESVVVEQCRAEVCAQVDLVGANIESLCVPVRSLFVVFLIELYVSEFRQGLEVLRIGLELLLQRLNPCHIERRRGRFRRPCLSRLLARSSNRQRHCAHHFRRPLFRPGIEDAKADPEPDQQKRPGLLLHAPMIAGTSRGLRRLHGLDQRVCVIRGWIRGHHRNGANNARYIPSGNGAP